MSSGTSGPPPDYESISRIYNDADNRTVYFFGELIHRKRRPERSSHTDVFPENESVYDVGRVSAATETIESARDLTVIEPGE
jgi:hypothetical protein